LQQRTKKLLDILSYFRDDKMASLGPVHLQNPSRSESQPPIIRDDGEIIKKSNIIVHHRDYPSCAERLMRVAKGPKLEQRKNKLQSGGAMGHNKYFASDLENSSSKVDDEGCNISDFNPLDITKKKSWNTIFEDDPLIIFGFDITLLSKNTQYYICATGVFGFTLVYSYLQELISVHIGGRKYALFLATCQFAGYSFWSFVLLQLRTWRIKKNAHIDGLKACEGNEDSATYPRSSPPTTIRVEEKMRILSNAEDELNLSLDDEIQSKKPSLLLFICLSLIRAIDLGTTNSAMKFINYPAKTLIKSSRSAFTLFVGIAMGKRGHSHSDYVMVAMLITGLIVFMRADINTDAIFHPYGVILLVISLCCDGIVGNSSELIMRQHRMSQDEFQLSIYSISFVAMLIATIVKGEFYSGIQNFFLRPGTITEITEAPLGLYHHYREEPTWTGIKKIVVMLIFTFTGLLGSSCAGALTKQCGALSMSIVSTNKKAATLFISFMAPGFNNRCTLQHFIGMAIFLCGTSLKGIPPISLCECKSSVGFSDNQGPPRSKIGIRIV